MCNRFAISLFFDVLNVTLTDGKECFLMIIVTKMECNSWYRFFFGLWIVRLPGSVVLDLFFNIPLTRNSLKILWSFQYFH